MTVSDECRRAQQAHPAPADVGCSTGPPQHLAAMPTRVQGRLAAATSRAQHCKALQRATTLLVVGKGEGVRRCEVGGLHCVSPRLSRMHLHAAACGRRPAPRWRRGRACGTQTSTGLWSGEPALTIDAPPARPRPAEPPRVMSECEGKQQGG